MNSIITDFCNKNNCVLERVEADKIYCVFDEERDDNKDVSTVAKQLHILLSASLRNRHITLRYKTVTHATFCKEYGKEIVSG